jgi:hypothetical protein
MYAWGYQCFQMETQIPSLETCMFLHHFQKYQPENSAAENCPRGVAVHPSRTAFLNLTQVSDAVARLFPPSEIFCFPRFILFYSLNDSSYLSQQGKSHCCLQEIRTGISGKDHPH